MTLRRLYDLALRRAAPDVWSSHRRDALDLFDDLRRDARRRGGRPAAARAVARAFWRLLERPAPRRREHPRFPPRHSLERSPMSTLLRDVRLALRGLGLRPGFTFAAVSILAVGIGATTTIWSVVDTVLLRRLPYPQAERLVFFEEGAHRGPDYQEWRPALGSFDALVAAWTDSADLVDSGAPEQVRMARISPDFLETFGATTVLGRELSAEDFASDAAVAVLGHGLWQRRWGGDPAILGRAVRLDGRPTTIVGVVAADFEPPRPLTGRQVDAWVPLRFAQAELQDRRVHVLAVAGRLAPGVDLAAAQSEMDAVRRNQAEAHPDVYRRQDGSVVEVPLQPLRDSLVAEVRDQLELLMGAVGLLLAIACVDVAILLLSRGTLRQREMALRGALGAGRLRLARQLLTESLILALLGGVAGVGLAYLGVGLFTRFQPGGLPRLESLAVDLRVLGFALLASLATGIVFGLLPALQGARVDASAALKDGGGGSAGRRKGRVRGALVVTEVALALALLMGAGVLMRSVVEMLRVPAGFETGGLLTFSLSPGSWDESSTYSTERRLRLVEDLRRDLLARPGVTAVAAGWGLPFVHTGGSRCCWRDGLYAAATEEPVNAMIHPVTAGYFATLRAPLVAGRDLDPSDAVRDPTPAVLERATAEKLFGDDVGLGRELRLGGGEDPDRVVVVGIVDGVRQWGLSEEVGDGIYVPYERFGGGIPDLQVAVRTAIDPARLVPTVREVVRALDADLPIDEVATMDERVARSLAEPRFLAGLLASFAAAALFLAVGGIYSAMSYWVSQRRRELGIRAAVGAERRDLLRLVLGHGLALAGCGLLLGALLARLGGGWLESLVWGISPTDPTTLAAAIAILAAAAVLACLLPATRAARLDPAQVLRTE